MAVDSGDCFFNGFALIAFCLLGIFLTTSCIARQNYGHARGGKSFDQTMSDLKRRLNLTEEQVAKVHPIIWKSFEKRQALRRQGGRSGSFQGREAKLEKDTERLLASVLTEKQMIEYMKYQKEQRRDRLNSMGGGRFGGGYGGRGGFGGGGF